MKKVQAISALLERKDKEVFLKLGDGNLTRGLRAAAELIRLTGVKDAVKRVKGEKLGIS